MAASAVHAIQDGLALARSVPQSTSALQDLTTAQRQTRDATNFRDRFHASAMTAGPGTGPSALTLTNAFRHRHATSLQRAPTVQEATRVYAMLATRAMASVV